MAVRANLAELTAYELEAEDLTAAYSEATRSRLERRAPTVDPVAVEHRIIAPTLANEPASRASALFLFSPERPITRRGRRLPWLGEAVRAAPARCTCPRARDRDLHRGRSLARLILAVRMGQCVSARSKL